MAKRKRLTPAQDDYLVRLSGQPGATAVTSAPIAQIASDSAAHAALNELSETFETARARGLMMVELPLEVIDTGYLVRDRLMQDDEDMTALMDSLLERGQQTPIEVVALPEPHMGLTHGLVSGWRRVAALRELAKTHNDPAFGTVRAVVIQPETAQSAYVSMVEENEIRVNLSFYERARIVLRTLQEGVYDSQKAALQGLFGNVARSKRSKIGSFISVVEAFDALFQHPSAISEKLGLGLARNLSRDPGFAKTVRAQFLKETPLTEQAEIALLQTVVKAADAKAKVLEESKSVSDKGLSAAPAKPVQRDVAPGVRLTHRPGSGKITLNGDGVNEDLVEALAGWFRRR